MIAVHILPQTDGIVRSPHGEHTGKRNTGHAGNKGLRAGGDDQLVIAHNLAVCEGDRLGGSIHGCGFHSRSDLHAGQPPVLFGGVHDELIPGLNRPAHIVGQAAARVGNIPSLGIDRDLGGPVLPHQLGGSLGARGDAANNNNVHTLFSFLFQFIY